MSNLQFPNNETELERIIRGETGYEDTSDELPQPRMDVVIGQTIARMVLETDTTESQIYGDNGLSFALASYGKIRAKASVENIPLDSYSFGAEDVSFDQADPEDSHQLQQWAEDVRIGLDASDLDESGNLQISDGAGYVGENFYYEDAPSETRW